MLGVMCSSNMAEADIERLRSLIDAATPGPWHSYVEGRDHESGSDFIQTSGEDIELTGATTADQDLIATSRNAIPLLIDEVERLRKEKTAIRGSLLGLVADAFNRSLRPLRDAGVVKEDDMSKLYHGVGTLLYDQVTEQMEISVRVYLDATGLLSTGHRSLKRTRKMSGANGTPSISLCPWQGSVRGDAHNKSLS
jgi:hypothetical protein